MKKFNLAAAALPVILCVSPVLAQSEFEAVLCEAAEAGRVIEFVYDKDASKECLPRRLDVHQVGLGNNGQLYLHGWQTRGCTSGRDYESTRIFRFDKIKSIEVVEGSFSARSQATNDQGWDGCIGSNCFIDRNICE